MAKRVTLASTFTAKYYPSQNLTDAFYLDGRLRSIREDRMADISFDREDRGFFLSLFTSADNSELKSGAYPSYEPKLSKFCTDVKYSGKKIDDMTRSFRELAVDITGRMMLQENETRNSYFSGLMIKDGEGFALTVGGGLAFLYRDDALYPLTDAGIPMEPIDAHGNSVADFSNYFCSKSAHVLWSNFFRLNVDDCIILCNKELYSALGQRELLRILDDANDQCDAAGTIITQAAARKPNIPMQLTISFVLDVKEDAKKSLFKRRKNNDENTEGMYVKSDFESGTLGQATKASANAGFAAGYTAAELTKKAEEQAEAEKKASVAAKNVAAVVDNTKILFGDDKSGGSEEPNADADIKFFGTEQKVEPAVEISAEEMMKRLFTDAKPSIVENEISTVTEVENAVPVKDSVIDTTAGINPFDMDSDDKDMKVVSSTEFVKEDDDSATKSIDSLDKFIAEKKNADNSSISLDASGILAATLKEQNISSSVVSIVNKYDEDKKEDNDTNAEAEAETPVVSASPVAAAVIGGSAVEQGNDILFTAGSVVGSGIADATNAANADFNPYGVGDSVKKQDDVPFVFGDDSVDILQSAQKNKTEEVVSAQKADDSDVKTDGVEKKEEKIKDETVQSTNENTVDKINDSARTDAEEPADVEEPEDTHGFLEVSKKSEEVLDAPEFTFADDTVYEEEPEQNIDFPETKGEKKDNVVEANVILPFENPVESVVEEAKAKAVEEEIPPIPNYSGDTFDSPAFVPNTDIPVGNVDNQNYAVGSYSPNEEQVVDNSNVNFNQPYGAEPINNNDYSDSFINGIIGSQQEEYGSPFNNFSGSQNDEFGGENMSTDNEFGSMGNDSYENGSYESINPVQSSYDDYQQYNNSNPIDSNQMYSEFNDGYSNAGSNGDYQNQYSSAPSSGMNDDEIARILGMGGFDTSLDGDDMSEPDVKQVARPVQRKSTNSANGQSQGKKPVQHSASGRPVVKRKEPTYFGLTKAGWIFIGIVAAILVIIILIIALGISKCNDNKEKKAKETEETKQTYEIVANPTTEPVETTQADPSAPIGRFVFSDYIGFRTWRDLLFNVYGITIEDTNDSRIAIIISYNGLPGDYSPKSGDILMLPPMGVLDGSIPNTYSFSGTEAPAPTDEVLGEIGIGDGSTETTAETVADTQAGA